MGYKSGVLSLQVKWGGNQAETLTSTAATLLKGASEMVPKLYFHWKRKI